MNTKIKRQKYIKGKNKPALTAQQGFTLVEIIVSFAILALISTAIIAAVVGMGGIQQRDSQTREDNATVEGQIASGEEPSSSLEGLDLDLGEYTLHGSADSYSSGLGEYTVLSPSADDPIPEPNIEDMTLDGAEGYEYKQFPITRSGYYRLQVWGARGADSTQSSNYVDNGLGGAGGYSSGIVYLTEGDVIRLYAGRMGTKARPGQGGYNGGGNAATSSYRGRDTGGGGGGSDVRIGTVVEGEDELSFTYYNRVIVAGGGGGAGSYFGAWENQDPTGWFGSADQGGHGGGSVTALGAGGTGKSKKNDVGEGGQINSRGNNAGSNSVEYRADFGYGGSSSATFGGGGGGGWFGGGAGDTDGGGGGSSWINSDVMRAKLKNSILKDYLVADYVLLEGLSSSDTFGTLTMIPGNANMPNPRAKEGQENIPMLGNNSDGYVKVSWWGEQL